MLIFYFLLLRALPNLFTRNGLKPVRKSFISMQSEKDVARLASVQIADANARCLFRSYNMDTKTFLTAG